MKISRRRLDAIISCSSFVLLFISIYWGLCSLFGLDWLSEGEIEDDGGRFPKTSSPFVTVAFIASYLIISKLNKAIINLKSKKQIDNYINEFYVFKQRYRYKLDKSSVLYRIIDDAQKELFESYKQKVNISDFENILDYKKSTYELIRCKLFNSICYTHSFWFENFNDIFNFYKEILRDKSVYSEIEERKHLNYLFQVLKEENPRYSDNEYQDIFTNGYKHK